MEVVNKVAVITGGGSGIGRGIGLALAAAGADVVVADINLKNAEDVVKEIEALGRRAIAFQCDVTNQANVEALADFAWAEMDHVELVFNNAGVVVSGMAVESSAKDLLWTYSVNAFGVWYGTVAFTRCQGRSKTRPVGRSKSRPVVSSQVIEYSGAKGLWSVAEEALRP